MEYNQEIIFGKHPVEDMLSSNKPISKLYVHNKLSGAFEVELRQICKERDIPLIRTEIENLNRLAGGRNHQGIVALISPIEFHDIEAIIPFLFEQNKVPCFLILDHIKDVRNFGAIARSAEIFGCDALIIPKKNSAAINKDAVKTSAGALLTVPVCRVSNLVDTVNTLKMSGIQIFSSALRTDLSIHDVDFQGPVAIVLGGEDHGITKEMRNVSDQLFTIPQKGITESLNVSVSTGIILYEVMRQRG